MESQARGFHPASPSHVVPSPRVLVQDRCQIHILPPRESKLAVQVRKWAVSRPGGSVNRVPSVLTASSGRVLREMEPLGHESRIESHFQQQRPSEMKVQVTSSSSTWNARRRMRPGSRVWLPLFPLLRRGGPPSPWGPGDATQSKASPARAPAGHTCTDLRRAVPRSSVTCQTETGTTLDCGD